MQTHDSARAGVVAVLAVVLAGCNDEPKTYDDCILKHVKAGMDKVAVLAVTRSCREKFAFRGGAGDRPAGAERHLTAGELAALTGRAGLSFGNYYSANIYNGNDGIAVTHLEILVTTTIDGKKVTRAYGADASIPRQNVVDVGFNIIVGDQGAPYSWSIGSARGRPVQ